MLYSTRFIPMACDWSLAVLSVVSHSQKYVCCSTKAKEIQRGRDCLGPQPGTHASSPNKSPFGRFTPHYSTKPKEIYRKGERGEHSSSEMQKDES